MKDILVNHTSLSSVVTVSRGRSSKTWMLASFSVVKVLTNTIEHADGLSYPIVCISSVSVYTRYGIFNRDRLDVRVLTM